jgi:HSP20 family molecular chaperone IbpA
MKGRIFVVVILVAAAAFAGRWVNRAVGTQNTGARREETRQTFKLDAGARVEVGRINGAVTVKTADTDTAEVHVVRTGSSADDLEYGRVTVEASPSSLVVRGERSGGRGLWHRLWNGGGQVRQEVTLVLPRHVELAADHVNGAVQVGEVEGSVEVSHVNGRVEVAQSAGRAEVSHVNGGVKFGVSQLGEEGMEVAHVNGNIEIRLSQLVNADVEAHQHNGALTLNVPNVTMQERQNRSNVRARFGAGGSPVQINHVNGNVRFESDAGATAATTNVVPTVIAAEPLPPAPLAPPAPPAPPAP